MKIVDSEVSGASRLVRPKTLLALALAMPLLASCAASRTDAPVVQDSTRPPNVVVFVVDDLGWRDVGFMGSDYYETPNIDQLAEESVIFTQAYSASPVCSPSRAALQTGRDPVRLGITDWIPGRAAADGELLEEPAINNELKLDEVTIAEMFKEAGYATFYAGKWHLGDEGYLPTDQGYDINKGGGPWGSPRGRERGQAFLSPYNNRYLEDGPDGELLMERLSRETSQFMRDNRDRPFLAVQAFYAVHTPINTIEGYTAPYENGAGNDRPEADPRTMRYDARLKARQDNAAYGSMVTAMDAAVGDVIRTVRELGLENDTIIVFTSDNGGLSAMTGNSRNAPTSNEPLRGSKGWVYEGGIRVPLTIHVPGAAFASESAVPTISMDLLPTLLDLAGIDSPHAGRIADGVSLVPAMRGESAADRNLYWHFPHYHATNWRPGGAIRSGRYKLIEYFEDGSIELFDLVADPSETTDIAAARPQDAQRLLEELRRWRTEVGAAMPTPRRSAGG